MHINKRKIRVRDRIDFYQVLINEPKNSKPVQSSAMRNHHVVHRNPYAPVQMRPPKNCNNEKYLIYPILLPDPVTRNSRSSALTSCL